MKLSPVRTVAPAATPVSLSEIKGHLRVDHDEDDALIGAYLSAAVARLDGRAGILGRCLITQTWMQSFPCWPADRFIRLPFCDVSEIVSVKYSDIDGVEQTVDSALYAVVQDEIGGVLWLKKAFTRPSLDEDRPDPVRITFKAGYGDADAVPDDLKHAIKLLVGDLYENREDTVVGVGLDVRPLPTGVAALIAPHRRVGF